VSLFNKRLAWITVVNRRYRKSHIRITTRRLGMTGIMTPAVRIHHSRFGTENLKRLILIQSVRVPSLYRRYLTRNYWWQNQSDDDDDTHSVPRPVLFRTVSSASVNVWSVRLVGNFFPVRLISSEGAQFWKGQPAFKSRHDLCSLIFGTNWYRM
jgi:hypothetical protein